MSESYLLAWLRNAAVRARVTGRSGRNRGGSVEHPRVVPDAHRSSTCETAKLPAVSVKHHSVLCPVRTETVQCPGEGVFFGKGHSVLPAFHGFREPDLVSLCPCNVFLFLP